MKFDVNKIGQGIVKRFRNRKFSFIHIFLFVVLFLIVLYLVLPTNRFKKFTKDEIIWGVSFSSDYAESLGLDARYVYERMLQEINIDSIRIPVYWDEVEVEPGKYFFDELDWQIDHAKKYDKSVVLAIGYKVPRWPECRKPNWASFSVEELQDQVESFMKVVVNRYKDKSNLLAWQIENEPYFEFGECMTRIDDFLEQEIKMVRELDPVHKVIVTDSGELSLWQKASKSGADVLGFTTYRKVYNPFLGIYFTWFLSSDSYRKKAQFISEDIKDIYAMELQLEPWHENFIGNVGIDEQKEIFTLDEIQANLDFGESMGASHTYLWGVEWWYYLEKIHNYSEPKELIIEYLQ